jgi:hypothetical protein
MAQMILIYGGGLQITDRYGVIRKLLMIRIYGVQILKCASLYFRVRMLPIYRLQMVGPFMICRLRNYRWRITDGCAVKCGGEMGQGEWYMK